MTETTTRCDRLMEVFAFRDRVARDVATGRLSAESARPLTKANELLLKAMQARSVPRRVSYLMEAVATLHSEVARRAAASSDR
jgi:hypothetical protein